MHEDPDSRRQRIGHDSLARVEKVTLALVGLLLPAAVSTHPGYTPPARTESWRRRRR